MNADIDLMLNKKTKTFLKKIAKQLKLFIFLYTKNNMKLHPVVTIETK